MLLETLSNPDIVLEEQDKEQNMFHERPSSYLFVKTFQKEDGSRYVHFESVTVSQEGMEISVSSHIIREQALEKKLKNSNVIYEIETLFPNSSEMHLAEHQNDVSDLLPIQGKNVSDGKDTNNSANSHKNSVESGGVDGFVSDAMSIVIKDVISFPNEIRDEDTILKEQKGGKRGDKVSVKVGLLDNNLYIQYKAGNLRSNRRYWATIKIPNATNYSAGQLRYRLDYAGTTTDVARLAGDAILELFNKNDLHLHKANWKEVTDNVDAALRDALVSVLRGAGIEVIDNAEEGQKVLDEANGAVNMQAKKRALETVSSSRDERYQQTVVSSANGTKILKILTKQFKNLKIHLSAKNIYRRRHKYSPEDVSKALSKAGFVGVSYPAQYRSGG
ncbi:MAG: hypothetical protein SOY43_04890 [Parabacteroides sp.]|nr:hypothetical protein [bacterium]MDY4102214.1 hypothetical protein [Parabacteroides sp.]